MDDDVDDELVVDDAEAALLDDAEGEEASRVSLSLGAPAERMLVCPPSSEFSVVLVEAETAARAAALEVKHAATHIILSAPSSDDAFVDVVDTFRVPAVTRPARLGTRGARADDGDAPAPKLGTLRVVTRAATWRNIRRASGESVGERRTKRRGEKGSSVCREGTRRGRRASLESMPPPRAARLSVRVMSTRRNVLLHQRSFHQGSDGLISRIFYSLS